MATGTTFQVIYLGSFARLDADETSNVTENAANLVGTTFGGPGNALANNIQTFSADYFGHGDTTTYDTRNDYFGVMKYDTFRIDGGAPRQVDATVGYNATLTYVDGTSTTLPLVLMQDTVGRLYLVPSLSYNATQIALEAKPIRSLTVDSVFDNNAKLGAVRYLGSFANCLTTGTAIRTPRGDIPVETLAPGDPVVTLDNGPQPVRWIGRTHHDAAALAAQPNLRPILIPRGSLGTSRDLLVSPLHGMLIDGTHLARAGHLAELARGPIRIARGKREITYIHLMFDAHQIVFAEGAPCESFYPGPMAQQALSAADIATLEPLFPGLFQPGIARDEVIARYGPPTRPFLTRRALANRLARAPRGAEARISG
ncbi:Hint domain-containing protein [Rhodovulum strictum]|uniref:Hemolysin n=1 Tax=Rhodovulum strictum TaxID=58314 RepID=A0A844BA87_9RHOB|nr:Hint domain-containing protein [Rhodovulum strictum]MRH19599.1 hemolysin [Rhodovulum strictum]